ncbi:DUF11 domain-containing protein [Actinomycetes bacterium KLBMP 9797]
MASRTRRLMSTLTVAVLGTGLTLLNASAAHAVLMVRVTVTIHHIWEVQCDDNNSALGDACGNDYFTKVFFPDGERASPRAPDDLHEVEPNWQLSGSVERDAGPIGVRIQLWDFDSTSGEDQIDIAAGDDNLDLTIDPRSGDFSGEIPTPNVGYATGTGEDSAAIYFSVTLGDKVDYDGDGIHDGIERSGIVTDRLGTIPPHGLLRALTANDSPSPVAANPCRPTVLVEVDFMIGPDGPDPDTLPDHTHRPRSDAVRELVDAFNAGDVFSRPECPYLNMDRSGGVQLVMVIDEGLPETDRLNWASGPGGVTGQSIRAAHLNPALRPYYHYSLWNHRQPDVPSSPGGPLVPNTSSGSCCSDSGKDVMVSLGGWTNDVGSTREQAGTFAHELGHALGLGHGGGDRINCKPNYHSIMNYVYQFTGIPDSRLPAPTADLNGDSIVDARDKFRLDYSRALLPELDEDRLHENVGIAAGPDLFFWDGDGAAPWRESAGNAAVDWDRDDPTNGSNPIDPLPIAADINWMNIGNANDPADEGCARATPPPGSLGVAEHKGYDDWEHLVYKGPLSTPAMGVPSGRELTKPTADFIRSAIRDAQSSADVVVTLASSADPVTAGAQFRYTLRAVNHDALNTAYATRLTQTLPVGVSFVSASGGCTIASASVTCLGGDLSPGSSTTATITVRVPADLVATGTSTLRSTAQVSHDGPDPGTANNTATTTTQVVEIADLSLTKTADRTSATANDPVQYTITVTNTGPSYASKLRVSDELPETAEASLDAATADHDGTCVLDASGDLACSWPDSLPVGQSRQVRVSVRVTDDGVQDHISDRAHTSFAGTDPVPANDSASQTTAIVKVPTTIAATPVVAHILPGSQVYIPELSARLIRGDDGRPVANRIITFTTIGLLGGQTLCAARTDTNGVAKCGNLVTSLAAVVSLGYRASSTEDGRYLATTNTGSLVLIG